MRAGKMTGETRAGTILGGHLLPARSEMLTLCHQVGGREHRRLQYPDRELSGRTSTGERGRYPDAFDDWKECTEGIGIDRRAYRYCK